MKQLYQDAKVASILCIGGPAKYVFKEDVAITDDWLFEHVVPNIRLRFPNDRQLCVILGTALLYICMQEESEVGANVVPVPEDIRSRVRQSFAHLGLTDDQPVKKLPLHVHHINETLIIDGFLIGLIQVQVGRQ